MDTNIPDAFERNEDIKHIEDLDWAVRAFVYTFITNHERPPTSDEAASALGITADRARLSFRRLNQRHALFLEPGTLTIRMAHPFSSVPTPFVVRANGHTYWANCAWDMLGIPAALHTNAEIEAHYADPQNTRVILSISNSQLHAHEGLVHFPLPFRRWYDNLVRT